jgi:hypothetical protein
MGEMDGRNAGRSDGGTITNSNPHNEVLTPADRAALAAKVGADVGNPHNENLTPADKAALDMIIREMTDAKGKPIIPEGGGGYGAELDAEVSSMRAAAQTIRKWFSVDIPSTGLDEAPPLSGAQRDSFRRASEDQAKTLWDRARELAGESGRTMEYEFGASGNDKAGITASGRDTPEEVIRTDPGRRMDYNYGSGGVPDNQKLEGGSGPGAQRSIIRFMPDGSAKIIRNPTDEGPSDLDINAEVGKDAGREMPYNFQSKDSSTKLPPVRGEAWNADEGVPLRGEAWNSGEGNTEK